MQYDDLMGQLDEFDDEIGDDALTDEAVSTLPYIGIPQARTDVPPHIKRLAGPNEFGFSTAHRDEEGNPFYEYCNELKFMVVASLTTRRGKAVVGGRKLQIPFQDEAGTPFSIFPEASQNGNGYGQACQSWNGLFPDPRFEGELLRDPRTGQFHRIGWVGNQQVAPEDVCASCFFKEWLDSKAQSLKGGRTPLCKPSWTWVVFVLPGQPGTNEEGDEIEIRSGLYRLTGNNTSVQSALYGVGSSKRDGTARWGALKTGEGIVGINQLTKYTGSELVHIPYSTELTRRQQDIWTGDIVDSKGTLVGPDKADKKPDDSYYVLSTPISKQFPEGRPELVGPAPVYPLVAITCQNNNSVNGKSSPISVPVTSIGEEPISEDDYMLYLTAWVEYMRDHKPFMASLEPGDYIQAQRLSESWVLESGSDGAIPKLVSRVDVEQDDDGAIEAEEIPFD